MESIFKEMANFSVPSKNEVSEKNQVIFDNLNKALGFVPNLYAVMAHSENALERYLGFQSGKNSLSNKEKEAINLIVSQVNGCRYCQSAHTVLGKMNGFTEGDTLDIRRGKSSNAKINSLVALAKELAERKGKAGDQALQDFYLQRYTKENLIDVFLQIGDKIIMNYLHNLTQIEIDFPAAKAI